MTAARDRRWRRGRAVRGPWLAVAAAALGGRSVTAGAGRGRGRRPACPAGRAGPGLPAGARWSPVRLGRRGHGHRRRGPQPRDPAALAPSWHAVSTPGSPEYHHYLARRASSPATFGPTPATIAATRAWLASSRAPAWGHLARRPPHPGDGPRPSWSGPSTCRWSPPGWPSGRVARFATQRAGRAAPLAPSVVGVVGLSTVARPSPSWCRPPVRRSATAARRRRCPRRPVVPAVGPAVAVPAPPAAGATPPTSWPPPTA